MNPRLSVVMPTFNNAPFVEDAVESILTQDHDDFELVIADHSSSDGTWEKLQRFASDPRVRLLTTEAGGGAERNFNRVSAAAVGEYVKMVCGDDLLKPGVLARQSAILDDNPDAVLTACPREIVDARGRTIIASRGLAGLTRAMPGNEAVRVVVRSGSNQFGEPGSVMMRRRELEEDGFWFFTYPYLVDQATYCRILMRGRFVPDLTVGAVFRMNGGQWSVALRGSQAEQVKGFHRWLAEHHPDAVSPIDERIGNRRAALMAIKRQVAYIVLRNRMR
ncbi:glycosyltransferase family A protein [Microcella daejeonensis]|uniref:Glycosyltransferase family A protein n=1 Tax=Microcella daejeonensis TaxID=2994971 RepID=A0A9E8S8R1_9MICO|nr:glycosyltransferase family A protein [Microcella daejeonensis]WAB81875.1 glycosyltransferase family A protein [Microcella daejeonensis]